MLASDDPPERCRRARHVARYRKEKFIVALYSSTMTTTIMFGYGLGSAPQRADYRIESDDDMVPGPLCTIYT